MALYFHLAKHVDKEHTSSESQRAFMSMPVVFPLLILGYTVLRAA